MAPAIPIPERIAPEVPGEKVRLRAGGLLPPFLRLFASLRPSVKTSHLGPRERGRYESSAGILPAF